jgi:hypothetical protein
MSLAQYARLRALGLGPAEIQPSGPGGKTMITPQAEDEWRERHTVQPAPKQHPSNTTSAD